MEGAEADNAEELKAQLQLIYAGRYVDSVAEYLDRVKERIIPAAPERVEAENDLRLLVDAFREAEDRDDKLFASDSLANLIVVHVKSRVYGTRLPHTDATEHYLGM